MYRKKYVLYIYKTKLRYQEKCSKVYNTFTKKNLRDIKQKLKLCYDHG